MTVCKISLAQNAEFYNITSIGFVPGVSSAAGSTDAGENLALIETRLTPVMIKLLNMLLLTIFEVYSNS